MLTQKDLPKVVIISVRKLIHRVKEMNDFFVGKLQLIQNKMKIISTVTPNFVPSILEEGGGVKDWKECSSSFDGILNHSRFMAYCNGEVDIVVVMI